MSAHGPDSVIADRFVLHELAGSGGMGQVYRALDRSSGETVALKLLISRGASTDVERFLREARVLSQLTHPGIVRYVAHGDDPVFLAMEWLEGEDLGRRLARSPLTLPECVELARLVTAALAFAHARGIVHRDVKPSNIFLVGGAIDRIKLLDFGIARLVQGTRAVTMSGQVVGTIGYMAPEQARDGKEVRPMVDVFSLGCLLFECLTGRAAFPGDRLIEVLAKVLFSEPVRASDVADGIPHALDELVLRMMRKDPADRPSLAAIAAELEAVASLRSTGVLRPRSERAASEELAISGDEQRLLCVILTDDGASARLRESSPTVPANQLDDVAAAIRREVGPFDGRIELLGSRSPLVVLSGTGAATDLAVRSARCSLALRRVLPMAGMAIAMGKGDPAAGAELGDVVLRAERMLALSKDDDASSDDVSSADVRPIRIDAVIAGLLDTRFELSGDAHGLELRAERELADPVRKLLGKATPFVGREREMLTLETALDECFAERIASAVLVTAPAGSGKSRLQHELLRGLDAHTQTWMARADPIAAGSSFAMIGQLVRRVAGLVDPELPDVRRQKLLARMARHLAPTEALRVAEFLGELVGAAFPDEGRAALRAARADSALMGDHMRHAWEDFVLAESGAGPIVIVLEDLHWGDLPTVRFIDGALRVCRARSLFVLALARPEVHDTFPGIWSERRVQEIRLRELVPRASRKLVTDVLGPRADDTTVNTLIERAGGNAFYLEELIRAVAEGRGEGGLPETVLAMAQARLERLTPIARRVLRAASVFGQAFWTGGVAALVADAPRDEIVETLTELAHREFVTKSTASRFSGEDEYTFRHALVRDAAYGMLTERDRALGHKLAGEWLEAAGERDAIVLAEHLARGGQPKGAVVWYLWAAEQAFEGDDLQSVIARAERGIQCGASGAMLGELRLLQAEASGWGARTHDHAHLARAALSLLPSGSGASFRAAAELAVASSRLGDHAQLRLARESLVSSDRSATQAEEPMTIAQALAIARTVIEHFTAGMAGETEALAALVDAAIRSAHEDDRAMLEAIRLWLASLRALFSGEPERYAREAAGLVEAFERGGQLRYLAIIGLWLGAALAAMGADEAAVAELERTVERCERMGLLAYREKARAWMAVPLSRLGQRERAKALAAEVLARSLESGDRVTEGRARASAAVIAWAEADRKAATDAAFHVVSQGAFPPDARADAAVILVRATLERDPARAVEMAAEELRSISFVRAGPDVRLRLAHADALEAAGRREEASVALDRLRDTITTRARAIEDGSLRASYLSLAEHTRVLDGFDPPKTAPLS